MGERKTVLWWRILSAIAVFNLSAWVVLAYRCGDVSGYTGWHLLCSGVFTAVCAFRSFWPRIDLERFCLVDAFASSMVLGRAAATVAEVSFATQIALLMHEMGAALSMPWLQLTPAPIVVLLSIAQVFCWWSVLTRTHIWHAVEESLWAFTFAMVGVCLALAAGQATGHWVWLTRVGLVCTALYVLFMVTVDVPMYIRRWRSGEFADQKLSLSDGWRDALHRREPTRDWATWQPEVAWLTGYFSVAVWISMLLVVLPRG